VTGKHDIGGITPSRPEIHRLYPVDVRSSTLSNDLSAAVAAHHRNTHYLGHDQGWLRLVRC
jgi:hypothetical protein